jgi:hypothetical protein
MVSYADFVAAPAWKRRALQSGSRAVLDVPAAEWIYLDHGAFYFGIGFYRVEVVNCASW